MTLSVRLAPELEARLEEEARRLGISKSEFVKDVLERSLGLKNPATLLDNETAHLTAFSAKKPTHVGARATPSQSFQSY